MTPRGSSLCTHLPTMYLGTYTAAALCGGAVMRKPQRRIYRRLRTFAAARLAPPAAANPSHPLPVGRSCKYLSTTHGVAAEVISYICRPCAPAIRGGPHPHAEDGLRGRAAPSWAVCFLPSPPRALCVCVHEGRPPSARTTDGWMRTPCATRWSGAVRGQRGGMQWYSASRYLDT